jgi:hypothetical protein
LLSFFAPSHSSCIPFTTLCYKGDNYIIFHSCESPLFVVKKRKNIFCVEPIVFFCSYKQYIFFFIIKMDPIIEVLWFFSGNVEIFFYFVCRPQDWSLMNTESPSCPAWAHSARSCDLLAPPSPLLLPHPHPEPRSSCTLYRSQHCLSIIASNPLRTFQSLRCPWS